MNDTQWHHEGHEGYDICMKDEDDCVYDMDAGFDAFKEDNPSYYE